MAGKTINHAEVKEILGRAIKYPAFRSKLLSSPEETLKQEGYDPHDAAVDFFKALNTGKFADAAKKLKIKGEHDPIEKAGEM